MSDERFDDDLRSILLEGAPRDVPDGLRRRVAAVPTTHPAPGAMASPFRRHRVALRIAAVAAVFVVLAVGLSRFGLGQPGVGDARPSSSSTGSPSPSQSSAATACVASDLVGRILGWQGAAGSRIADVEIENATTRPCSVRGTPGLQLVDSRARILIDSTTAGPRGQPHVTSVDPSLELAPNARLRTEVRASNYCGPVPSPPIDIAFILPGDGGRFVASSGPGVSSAEAVPPCLGSTGGQIEMNGWRR